MNRKEFIDKVSARTNMTKKATDEVVTAITDIITEALVSGDSVKIVGFGAFSVADRPARQGRNPLTGESLTISASKSPKFKASKTLKDAINA